MSLSIWKTILIDRIHMTLSIKEDHLYKFAWGQLWGIHDIRESLMPKGKITIHPAPYSLRISFYPEKKRKVADIEVGKRYKNQYFKLILYPSKFVGDDFCELKHILNTLLPDFSYDKLFTSSHVNYIELACDSLTHHAHSFIPFREKVNHSKIFMDGSIKGSTYLGSETSHLVFCIYDKAKQLADKKQPVPHKLHTRIEARAKKTKLAPAELLHKMPNPFQKLCIADITTARAVSNDLDWLLFLETCETLGSASALSSLTKSRRASFMKRLHNSRANWWKADSRWAGLSYALQEIAP